MRQRIANAPAPPFGLSTINASPGLAFAGARCGALRLARQHVQPWQWRRDWPIAWLIALIAIIGMGRRVVHALATFRGNAGGCYPIAVYRVSFTGDYSWRTAKLLGRWAG
jgi:hypothetical protein